MSEDPPPQEQPGALPSGVPQATAEPNSQPALNRESDPLFCSYRFLTDHNVPKSVGDTLIGLGQNVVRLRDVMAVDAPDPVVAKAAMEDERVLVSWDRDFNQQIFKSPRFARLSRLSMSVPETEGPARLGEVFDIIAFALRRAAGKPVTIRVGKGKVQIEV